MTRWTHDTYINRLKSDCDAAYEVAELARSKGFDPRLSVEIRLNKLGNLLKTTMEIGNWLP